MAPRTEPPSQPERDRAAGLPAMLQASPEAVLWLDREGRILDANPASMRLFERDPSGAPGQDFFAWALPPQARPDARAAFDRLLAGTEVQRVEIERDRADGRSGPVELTMWPAGPHVAAQGVCLQARALQPRQADDAPARYRERFHAVVERLGEGMIVIQDGVVVFANRQASTVLRIAPERLLGLRAVELLHPDDRAAVAERLARREAGQDLALRTEIRRLDEDGGVRWLETHSTHAVWEGRAATMSFFADATERRSILEALRRSQERYRAVVEHVDDGMVVVKDTRFVFVNPRAAQLVEMTEEEMLREGYLHRVHPDDRAIVDERRRRRLAGEEVPNRYEIRLLLPRAGVRWIDIGVTIVPWDGELATLTFFSDVTERKQLEARLKSTLQERETILQSSIVGIAFLNPDGRLRWANEAMLQIFGAPSLEHTPGSMEPLYESREQYLHVGGQVAQAIRRGEAFQTELRMRRLDGSLLWALLSGKAVNRYDLDQGTVWVVMDISRRKELEEQLRHTSSEREAILNSALVGIVLAVGRRLVWVNPKFAEMVGYAREELTGRSAADIHPDLQEWEQLGAEQAAALREHGSFTHERQLRRRNGERFWVQLAGRCLRDRDPDSGVIWTLLDITQRRKAEDDTLAALTRQRELNELRSRFVSMTSHEFRTPLASILSSAELLRDYGERLPASEKAEVFATIESSVQRMTGMLERVLQIGRAEARMVEFQPQRCDLVALCARIAQEATAALADGDAQRLRCDLPAQPVPGSFDEKLLRHILVNLLGNAFKYSPDGGSVVLRVLAEPGWARIEVVDQGIGIPAGELEHLFESFHRATNVGNIPGTGLGLAIVKSSVDLHGGRIDVRSEPGRGTAFCVRLPLA